jgi:SAM-dependent methyltransferase
MSDKYGEEIRFWKDEIKQYVCWYQGQVKELYGVPAPRPEERITRWTDNLSRCAIETWVNADKWRYCKHLFVEPTYFSGKKVLDVGPGPLGLSRFFAGAQVTGIDPLCREYVAAGYPIHSQGIHYECCHAEEMVERDRGEFDATISVNAIDHVDDFERTIREIERVTHASGEIRIECHYHAATVTEPNVLNDDIVRAAFKQFEMRKLSELPSTRFYPAGTHPQTDRFALWSNRAYLYPAVDVLR